MNDDPQGYYAALHLTPSATQADIQRAFRRLIRLHHPDVSTSPARTSAVLRSGGADVRRILAAFAVLRDPLIRADYDRRGRNPDAGASRGAAARDGAAPDRPRDIPVRHHGKGRNPVLRVTPVRWERGPSGGHS